MPWSVIHLVAFVSFRFIQRKEKRQPHPNEEEEGNTTHKGRGRRPHHSKGEGRENGRTHPREVEEGSTTEKEVEKAAPPKSGKLHHTKRERANHHFWLI